MLENYLLPQLETYSDNFIYQQNVLTIPCYITGLQGHRILQFVIFRGVGGLWKYPSPSNNIGWTEELH